nr:hypothetical protein [Tanacetum cinerariifolium]
IKSVPEPQSVGNVCVTPRGSRYWTPVVPENEKPVKKMMFVSLDQAIEFYNNYAKKAGFEPRMSSENKGNLNMGPRKGFKVLKQARGSFDKVGTTETDSKNYKRDTDLFIGEEDTHMAIEKLEKKKSCCQTFHMNSCKLGSTLCKSEFLERINDIVWSKTLTPEQFELNWIPSYFCDLPLAGLMQMTSRCEGENYFFELLTNTDLFLVDFINHFETAMDAQRNIQRNNDHDSRYKAPQLRTSFQFEKEAAEIFTIAAFKVIQSQIVKSMIFFMSYNVTDVEGGQRYFIKDVDDDVKLRDYL